MAITAATLGNLLTCQADYNYYIQQQIFWTNKYDANSAKLAEQSNFYNKWESAYDDAQNADKTCKIGNKEWKKKDEVLSDVEAERYAHEKVKQYNEELSLELADLDIEYDTMKTMYDTLVQELSALKDSEKQLVSTNAQDTGLLNAG